MRWLAIALPLSGLILSGCEDSVSGFLSCGIEMCSAREECVETSSGPTCVCAEGFEGIALGLVGLAALFVILLFAVPPVMDYLRRREHRDLMVNRRPWSDKAASRKRQGRGEQG